MSVQFYTEPIEVEYVSPPPFRRRPSVPDRFIWRGETFHIAELRAEWRQITPRISASKQRLGLARIYFRVMVISGRLFDIYFDPVHQKGAWFLSCEHV